MVGLGTTLVLIPSPECHTIPSDGELINRRDVRIEGTIRNPLGWEIGVTVNGTLAIVDGDHFVANHIVLEDGENTITVTAVDMEGNTESDSITVYAQLTDSNYVRITADPESGVAPFQTTLRVEGPFAFAGEPVVTYTGPGQVEFLESTTAYEFPVKMTTPGLYEFTVQVTDDQNNTYSDTVAVTVLNLQELDTLLKAKWNGMREALSNGNIGHATDYIAKGAREMFGYNFNLMSSYLGEIPAGLRDIAVVQVGDGVAEYEMWAEQGGRTYSFYILFVKDSDGIWRIRFF